MLFRDVGIILVMLSVAAAGMGATAGAADARANDDPVDALVELSDIAETIQDGFDDGEQDRHILTAMVNSLALATAIVGETAAITGYLWGYLHPFPPVIYTTLATVSMLVLGGAELWSKVSRCV